VVQTVTLEVTAPEAEVLNLASFQGKIRLALRNQLNTASFQTRGVNTSQLCNATLKAKAPVVARTEPHQQPKNKERRASVQVIKGMEITEAKL
jgi:Flp pilus assembly protein CpaB